jgi:RND family efflux transporter MFP subunit
MNPDVDVRQLAVRRDPEAATVRPRQNILTRYLLPGFILVGFLIVAAWAARESLRPSHPVTVVPVLTTRAEVEAEGTPLFQAAGWVEPRPTPTLVSALAEGVVERLLVVEGQEVKAGQPVAMLIDADARLAVRGAEADLKLRRAETGSARAGLAAATVNFEQPIALEAALAEAEAALAQKETEQAVLPQQLKAAEAKALVARQDRDAREMAGDAIPAALSRRTAADLSAATASVEELRARQARLGAEVAALKSRRDALRRRLQLKVEESRTLAEAKAQVEATDARLKQAEVALETARLKLDRTTVRAPVSGRVLALIARPGARLMGVNPTSTPDAATVVSLYDPSHLQVRADVRLENVPRVVPGMMVRIETPAAPAGPLTGRVLYATAQADIQKNTLQVKVSIDAPPDSLRPDMLVQVTFLAPPVPKSADAAAQRLHVLVPRSMIEGGDGGPRVWVADRAAGVARLRPVQLGGMAGEFVEVVSGLSPTDKLIAGGREGLNDGERIRVTGEEAGPSAPIMSTGSTVKPSRLMPAMEQKPGN